MPRLKPPSFSTNRSPKNAGTIPFMFRERFGVFHRFGRRLAQHFGGFFQQINKRMDIERKVSTLADLQRTMRLEVFCIKQLWTLISFSKLMIKIIFVQTYPIAVDEQNKTFPTAPLIDRSYLAGRSHYGQSQNWKYGTDWNWIRYVCEEKE